MTEPTQTEVKADFETVREFLARGRPTIVGWRGASEALQSLKSSYEQMERERDATQRRENGVREMWHDAVRAHDVVRSQLEQMERERDEAGWLREQNFSMVKDLNEKNIALMDTIVTQLERIEELEKALDRLAKVDPLVTDSLPFIDATREFYARVEFAQHVLDTPDTEEGE